MKQEAKVTKGQVVIATILQETTSAVTSHEHVTHKAEDIPTHSQVV